MGKTSVAQLVKLRGEVRLVRRVRFVHGNHRRLARAPQQFRQFLIERHRTAAPIHHQHHARRVIDRIARLPQNFAGNSGFVLGDDPARVHHFEGAPFPIRVAVDAVARDARLVGHNRAPRPGQPVE